MPFVYNPDDPRDESAQAQAWYRAHPYGDEAPATTRANLAAYGPVAAPALNAFNLIPQTAAPTPTGGGLRMDNIAAEDAGSGGGRKTITTTTGGTTTARTTGGGSTSSGTSTATIMPTEPPGYANLGDMLRRRAQQRLSSSVDTAGMEASGIANINQSFQGIERGLDADLTSRGLASSPMAGNAKTQLQTGRAGSIADFLNELPMRQRQMEAEDFSLAEGFFAKRPMGQTSTGSTSSTTALDPTETTTTTPNTTTTSTQTGGGWEDILGLLAAGIPFDKIIGMIPGLKPEATPTPTPVPAPTNVPQLPLPNPPQMPVPAPPVAPPPSPPAGDVSVNIPGVTPETVPSPTPTLLPPPVDNVAPPPVPPPTTAGGLPVLPPVGGLLPIPEPTVLPPVPPPIEDVTVGFPDGDIPSDIPPDAPPPPGGGSWIPAAAAGTALAGAVVAGSLIGATAATTVTFSIPVLTASGAVIAAGTAIPAGTAIAGVAGAGAGAAGAGGAAGAVGASGAATGGLGSTIASLASNPITIGIAAGIAGVTALLKSQAHWEANDFVQNFENPFAGEITDIHGGFFGAAQQGALSLEQAQAVRAQVGQQWEEWKTKSQQWGSGGNDKRTASTQGIQNLTPWMTQILADMDTVIGQLGG